MQEQDWKTLASEIHAKCIAYDYSDSGDYTLSEYITNLLQTGNQIDQINQELQQLVGSDYDVNLTAWMFSRIEEMQNSTPVKSAPAAPQQQTSSPKPNRIFAQAIGGLNGGSPSSSRREQRERSRSRSPEPRERRPRQRTPERPRASSPSSSSFTILSRLGRSNDRQVSVASSDARPSVFDRLGAAKPSSTQTANRCKYWPACNQGEQCPYFHPKTICPDFPNCSKDASECMFIHPEVSPSQQQQQRGGGPHPSASSIMTAPAKKPFPCRYFPYCTNPVCPFIHPDPSSMPMAPQQSSQQPQQQQQQSSTTPTKVPIPCKNGENCKRPGCHFLHPGEENPLADVLCKYDGACTRPNCFYKHTVPPMSHSGGNKSLILNKKNDMSQRQFSVQDDQVERMVVGESADLIKNNNGQAETTTATTATSNGEPNAA
ncbi:hypothetical protein O0I10_009942 [Lichtheimia ornata]|uniref:C3H1-type domain-containing protein n=1 Tax=Lichtheimia ornata TaxID=688661 RepID=A0AAD7UX00_9FUNG|nr:uncharacterized protein O0I10_009942 [Lichtheimia ornata]KAJ8654374.1 hypothetical protein O0I10_009942 [Lichtheimia ornata]